MVMVMMMMMMMIMMMIMVMRLGLDEYRYIETREAIVGGMQSPALPALMAQAVIALATLASGLMLRERGMRDGGT
jgi:hypothetical protein